jgi:hypothetical protein
MKTLAGLTLLLGVYAQSTLAPPSGSVLLLKATAKGVQIYTCQALEGDGSKFAYDAAHAEPDALLASKHGAVIIHHYLNLDPAGPAWESVDGSKIVVKKLDAQAHTGTIPWLLLQVVAHEGSGVLGKAAYVRRIDTTGGTAPSGACDPHKAPRVRVPYTAVYEFYRN